MILLSFLLLATVLASFQEIDYASLYQLETLRRDSAIYAPNLRGIWEEDLLPRLKAEDRGPTEGVRLNLPLVGVNRHPLDFYALWPVVTMPIMSVRFLDDMALAVAWLDGRGCDTDAVSDYVGIFALRGPSAFGGAGGPLEVLGISRDRAIANASVNDAALKAAKSGIFFLMAHELGHIRFGHRRAEGLASQRQEIEADQFALALMREIAVIPVGISIWFTMASRWELGPATTHPLTSDRLLAIAAYLRQHARDFTLGQASPELWLPRVHSLADDIGQIGTILDDPKIRDYQTHRSLTMDPTVLRSSCP
jgi:hypothetical protein